MLVAVAGELFHNASGLNTKETAEFARLAHKIRDNILKTGIPEGLTK
jgi:phosphoenolpyruvate synthase/pyruvate phosphate dikinase